MSRKLIIAHRGASGYAKDNTIEAFEKAIAMGADKIEFDVRRTKDGVAIAYHDGDIAGLPVDTLSYEELLHYDSDIPTVEKVLDLARGKIGVDVELKETGYEKEVIELVLKYQQPEEIVVTSFYDSAVKAVKTAYPYMRCGLLLGVANPENVIKRRLAELFPVSRCREAGADFVAPNWQLLKLGFLQRMRSQHIPVILWTVNEQKRLEKYMQSDIIEGIITDFPDVALAIKNG